MKNESDFKKVFCDSAHKHGGYTFKIAASIMNGLPDLYCAIPGYIPVLLELKWMKIPPGAFSKKIPYRPMQQEILSSCNRVYKKGNCGPVAFGLIGLSMEDGNFCMLIDPKFPSISSKDTDNKLTFIENNNHISIQNLFSGVVPFVYKLYRTLSEQK